MNLANWRTTLTAIGAALTSALTVVAALPAQLGELSTIIPEASKVKVVVAGLIATTILRILNGLVAKDARVVGNGTFAEPNRVPDGEGGTKLVGGTGLSGLPLLLLTGLTAFSLTACTTTRTDAGTLVTTPPTPEQLAAYHQLLRAGLEDYKTIRALR